MRQVLIYPGEDGYWVAEVPSLPGCISQGKTRKEALINAKEAVDAYINALKEDGLSVPEERFKALLERIAIDPKVMVGKPVIRGTRLTIECILERLACGSTMQDILEEYPGLEKDDVLASILFAEKALQTVTFIPESL